MTCYDWDADGSHDLIGEFFTSLSELGSGQAKLSWDLVNEKKKAKKKGYKNSGVVHCTVEVSEIPCLSACHQQVCYVRIIYRMSFSDTCSVG